MAPDGVPIAVMLLGVAASICAVSQVLWGRPRLQVALGQEDDGELSAHLFNHPPGVLLGLLVRRSSAEDVNVLYSIREVGTRRIVESKVIALFHGERIPPSVAPKPVGLIRTCTDGSCALLSEGRVIRSLEPGHYDVSVWLRSGRLTTRAEGRAHIPQPGTNPNWEQKVVNDVPVE